LITLKLTKVKRPKAPRSPLQTAPFRIDRGIVIDINCRSRKPLPSPQTFRRLAVFVLKSERVSNARISIQLVDDGLMKKYNADFKKKRGTTDVLSFDFLGPGARRNFVFADVAVSAETAYRRAAELDLSPFEEMFRYAIHGLLHLLDYDDLRPAQRRLMWGRQETLLRKFLAV